MEFQKIFGELYHVFTLVSTNLSLLCCNVPIYLKHSSHHRFHVDDLSSAHVYLRLKKDQRLEDVSDKTVMECAQLVKANSIEGCKLKEVHVIYTRWSVTYHLVLTCLEYCEQ